MEEQNKEVVRISDEGIVFIDYLLADYTILVNLIASNNCILLFDSEEAFNSLNELIQPFINDRCSYKLAIYVKKFIAEQYAQQVSTNSL